MRHSTSLRALCLSAVVATAAVAAAPVTAEAAVAEPAWAPIAASGPTNLAPEGEGEVAVYVQNVGGATSSNLEAITLVDELPEGLLTSKTPEGEGWSCLPSGAGQAVVTCETTEAIGPGLTSRSLLIPVSVGPAPGEAANTVTVTGGGAATPGRFEAPIKISAIPAKPGVAAFTVGTYNADGTLTTQAGSHPYSGTSAFFVNTVRTPGGAIVPAGDPKTIEVELPPGLIGSPEATPRCEEGLPDGACPISTQVGVAKPIFSAFGGNGEADAIHSVEAPVGYPAKYTVSIAGAQQVNVVASLRSDEDYGVNLVSPNTPQLATVYGAFVTLWGAPADPSHDGQRCKAVDSHSECGPSTAENTAFITMPSDCALQAAQPPVATIDFDTWLTIGEFEHQTLAVPAVSGCDQLALKADVAFQPDRHSAATPSAFTAELTLPQEGLTDPSLLATPPLKQSVISFPPGLTLNPSAADGLESCSEAQVGMRHPEPPAPEFPEPNRFRFDKNPASCPDASKIGTVKVETALLEDPLEGALFLAAQDENPFGSLLAAYLVIEDPKVGIVAKLPAKLYADPASGQLSAVVDDIPQVAFGSVKLQVQGGDRGPLATPDTCGAAITTAQLTPWSAPESGPPTESTDSFDISAGPDGAPCPSEKKDRPFRPGFRAGTAGAAAGTYSPLGFKVTRKDGEQELKGVQITLPRGLIGKVAGIGACTEAEIAAAEAKTGKAEQANPSCPASSEVGRVTAGAGIGNAPIYVSGKAYLAGPYKGAPLSVVTIVPAVAGPFDLGSVVSRTATRLDPVSGQLSAVSDPIPHLLEGVPVELRSLRIDLDRPGFTLTPTSCAAMSITAMLTGSGGDTASAADDTNFSASTPFQVGGCEKLAFKPKFGARLRGGTHRGDFPALSSSLAYPRGPGYANTRSVQVTLPHSEFLEQGHIRTVCTRVQFAAGGGNGQGCPGGSVYGHVEAFTPLLDQPLTGNVYLRSSPEHELPDLVLALQGPPSLPVEVDAAGRIDSIHGGIRATFDGLPDAPLTKVKVTMGAGKKGLLVNSRNLCSGRPARMTVRIVAQNNARADRFPLLGNGCKKTRKGHRRGHGKR